MIPLKCLSLLYPTHDVRWVTLSVVVVLVSAYGASGDIVIFGTSLSDDGHGITPLIRQRLDNPILVSAVVLVTTVYPLPGKISVHGGSCAEALTFRRVGCRFIQSQNITMDDGRTAG